MIRLDKEITVLVISFFVLCTVAVLMTANSNGIISAIQDSRTDKTPMENLIDNIPANGCKLESITDIPNSTTNGGTDHRLSIICVE